MKQPFLTFLVIVILCTSKFDSVADKKFVFAYDTNGNRTTLTFTSTCRKKNPKDSAIINKDTIVTMPDTAVLNKIQPVTQPSIYPTLVHTDFLISFPSDIQNGILQISDLNGNILFTENNIRTANTVVSLCNQPAGMYTVTVYYNNNKEPFVQKIIKQ